METRIEIEAPAKARSILVFQGPPLNTDLALRVRDDLAAALGADRWPVLMNYDGAVYWVPVVREEDDDPSPAV